MDLSSITTYIASERARGVSDLLIRQALINTGWKADIVDKAFGNSNAPVQASSNESHWLRNIIWAVVICFVTLLLIGIASSGVGRPSNRNDAKKISSVGQIQLALELYFDAYQKYPEDLAELRSKKFIPDENLNTFMSEGGVYAHSDMSQKEGYHLGISLDNPQNAELSIDVDLTDAYIHGSDDRGCRNEPGLHCYDVTP